MSSLKIWVQSSHNASGYFTIYGDDSMHNDHFNVRLITGDSSQTYARTGYLGFLRRTECVQADGGMFNILSYHSHLKNLLSKWVDT